VTLFIRCVLWSTSRASCVPVNLRVASRHSFLRTQPLEHSMPRTEDTIDHAVLVPADGKAAAACDDGEATSPRSAGRRRASHALVGDLIGGALKVRAADCAGDEPAPEDGLAADASTTTVPKEADAPLAAALDPDGIAWSKLGGVAMDETLLRMDIVYAAAGAFAAIAADEKGARPALAASSAGAAALEDSNALVVSEAAGRDGIAAAEEAQRTMTTIMECNAKWGRVGTRARKSVVALAGIDSGDIEAAEAEARDAVCGGEDSMRTMAALMEHNARNAPPPADRSTSPTLAPEQCATPNDDDDDVAATPLVRGDTEICGDDAGGHLEREEDGRRTLLLTTAANDVVAASAARNASALAAVSAEAARTHGALSCDAFAAASALILGVLHADVAAAEAAAFAGIARAWPVTPLVPFHPTHRTPGRIRQRVQRFPVAGHAGTSAHMASLMRRFDLVCSDVRTAPATGRVVGGSALRPAPPMANRPASARPSYKFCPS
jgi:hypothetical protein